MVLRGQGVWNLTGKVVLDGDDYFEFQCDDEGDAYAGRNI